MKPLDSPGQENQNVQYDFFGHVMPNSIINGTIHFPGLDNQNKVQHDILSHVMPLVLASASHDVSNIISHTMHSWGQVDQIDVKHYFLSHMTPVALVWKS